MKWFKYFLKNVGPGLTTGAADNDPSGIATYAQAGAQFGYGQLWVAFLILPFLTAVQEACVRIGGVTNHGISSVIKDHYNKTILFIIVFLLLIANIINIGADIAAMAAAAQLLVPIKIAYLSIGFTIIILCLEIFLSYKIYSRILIWLCLSLLAYPISVFIVKQPWLEILKATFVPHIQLSFEYLFLMTGIFGTTISPYMFFWQASQVVEEKKQEQKKRNAVTKFTRKKLTILRVENFFGMLSSEIVSWSIIVLCGTVLHGNGITNIKSAADAAKALEPLLPHYGYLSKFIFSMGILGLGFLSIPILAGAAAYTLSAAVGVPNSLDARPKRAKSFYGIIVISTLIGLLITFIGINPIKALIYAAVINGIVAVPLILMIFLIAKNKKILGKFKSGKISQIFIGITLIIMTLSCIGAIGTFFAH